MRWEVQVITGLPGLNIADIGRLKPRNKSEDESEQDTELGKKFHKRYSSVLQRHFSGY